MWKFSDRWSDSLGRAACTLTKAAVPSRGKSDFDAPLDFTVQVFNSADHCSEILCYCHSLSSSRKGNVHAPKVNISNAYKAIEIACCIPHPSLKRATYAEIDHHEYTMVTDLARTTIFFAICLKSSRSNGLSRLGLNITSATVATALPSSSAILSKHNITDSWLAIVAMLLARSLISCTGLQVFNKTIIDGKSRTFSNVRTASYLVSARNCMEFQMTTLRLFQYAPEYALNHRNWEWLHVCIGIPIWPILDRSHTCEKTIVSPMLEIVVQIFANSIWLANDRHSIRFRLPHPVTLESFSQLCEFMIFSKLGY